MLKTFLCAGVDEAGRGPLAGPVVAAAVIFHPDESLVKFKDSKQLTLRQRERLYDEIFERALTVGIGMATPAEIDSVNILQASLHAMQRALQRLDPRPTEIWIDGNHCPHNPFKVPMQALIKGDSLMPVISAASIIAKVTRDRMMEDYDSQYPGYDFKQHKGYPTAEHVSRLKKLGPCAIHRLSFAPVRASIRKIELIEP